MSTEEWRPVVGYEGLYEVSSEGRVRSLDRITGGKRRRRIRGQMLTPTPHPDGRRVAVSLCKDGIQRAPAVHRLVAAAFLGPRPVGLDICHGDGNGFNNAVANLRYDTRSANLLDSVRHGTHPWARRTHCKNGHEFTPENTAARNGSDGTGRRCIACRRAVQSRRAAS
jgi:hypothetical protein